MACAARPRAPEIMKHSEREHLKENELATALAGVTLAALLVGRRVESIATPILLRSLIV